MTQISAKFQSDLIEAIFYVPVCACAPIYASKVRECVVKHVLEPYALPKNMLLIMSLLARHQ